MWNWPDFLIVLGVLAIFGGLLAARLIRHKGPSECAYCAEVKKKDGHRLYRDFRRSYHKKQK